MKITIEEKNFIKAWRDLYKLDNQVTVTKVGNYVKFGDLSWFYFVKHFKKMPEHKTFTIGELLNE